MSLLEVSNASKSFGGIQALDACSIGVEKGSITGLIGPNGSGKTTLFNVITGYVPADVGDIMFDGKPINNPAQDKVWDFLFDIPKLSQCVPGIESVEVVDEKTYRSKLVVKVGPIKSSFTGIVTLTEVDAPNRIAGTVEGDDKSSASFVKASFTGTLKSVDGGGDSATCAGCRSAGARFNPDR
ncbi:MAG: SRPBCC domain-containing protein [Chloroflexota bacterium]